MGTTGAAPKEPRSARPRTRESSAALDDTDAHLVELLQREGRLTLSELGRRVSLSPAAVTERVRRLEEGGVITGYGARVDPERLGYGITAFVRVSPHGGFSLEHPRTRTLLERPEIREAHCVVGEAHWILKIAVPGTAALRDLLDELGKLGTTTTSIVLHTPVEGRPLPVRE
ncbi:Lrp/AsnC family transcriptional regulator [Streptomyces polyrhachis]|uniref:Lrp/AsnC family transcriptional regulator n=1 Tax=Streptomyces polyrhachis TaxID=1282885 RepID=A0ABW2GMN6_9ACTN